MPLPPDSQEMHTEPERPDNRTTLDLLMDMELPLLVRFGSTRMPLRDLMNLTAGSVIEFGRPAESPVEILVNGHVVAQGTAVVVQGHYGVQISQIAEVREGIALGSAFSGGNFDEGKTN